MSLAHLSKKLAALGKHNRHRHAILISGDADQGLRVASEICSGFSAERCILYQPSADIQAHSGFISINRKKAARRYLGSELDCAAICCHRLLDADAIGILSGCIRSGGFMIFLTPSLFEWPKIADTLLSNTRDKPSAYLERAAMMLENCQQLIKVSVEGVVESDLPEMLPASVSEVIFSEQRVAIDTVKAIINCATASPVVLESDRGRGKSAALGIAARELIETRGCRIGATGHGRRSTETLIAHACQGSEGSGKLLRHFSPDSLLETRQEIDLLLVDEAAALPLSILNRLLGIYPRIAFASTVHGYEGTGKGFSVKFQKILDQQKPAWRLVKLEEPIRWGRNDPLESLINRLLLLDAEPLSRSMQGPATAPALKEHDPACLIKDEEKLRNLFAILARAHYRTAPSDLSQMLDGHDLRIFGLEDQAGNMLSVALVAIEGRLPEELVERIKCNQRRPKHHLLPVSLCTQLGLSEALSMLAARVVRIAVNPNFTGHSYGKQLMSQIIRRLEPDFDLIGASFGLDSPLHGFWTHCGFSLIRIGIRKNRSTDTHSGLVIRGLSAKGRQLSREAEIHFSRNLPSQAPLYFQGMDQQLLDLICKQNLCISPSDSLNSRDYAELREFASGHCNPDRVSTALKLFAETVLSSESSDLEERDREILQQRLSLHRTWPAIAQTPSSSEPLSKREALSQLREIVSRSLVQMTNNAS